MKPHKFAQLWDQVTKLVMRDLVRAMQEGQRDVLARDHLTSVVEAAIQRETERSNVRLSAQESQRLHDLLLAEGAPFKVPAWLIQIVEDETVDELIINGADTVLARRGDELERLTDRFQGEVHLLYVVNLLLNPAGKAVGTNTPAVWATFEDGSQMLALISDRTTIASIRIKRT